MSRMISGGMLLKLTWVGVPQVSQMIVLFCGEVSERGTYFPHLAISVP
jgi:hypothetical protein